MAAIPQLWNPSNPLHKYRQNDDQWQRVVNNVNVIHGSSFDEGSVKKQWKNLRDCFMRNHRALTTVPTGSGRAAVPQKWKFYDEMEFLLQSLDTDREHRQLHAKHGALRAGRGDAHQGPSDRPDFRKGGGSPVPTYGEACSGRQALKMDCIDITAELLLIEALALVLDLSLMILIAAAVRISMRPTSRRKIIGRDIFMTSSMKTLSEESEDDFPSDVNVEELGTVPCHFLVDQGSVSPRGLCDRIPTQKPRSIQEHVISTTR
ncbi:hypothetical protein Q1695_003610 [Nippostrongylus brasiliensis]|nr:hypothetical protein Q1695_003610 [Nippostrongylus brasiliensis]